MRILTKNLLSAALCAALATASVGAAAAVLTGKVIRVADGDTITVRDEAGRKHRVRLQGIDAPEKQQRFGQACKRSLTEKVIGEIVTVEYEDEDRYGRILGTVYFGERNLNLEQVEEGCAWFYRYYAKDIPEDLAQAYYEAEVEATASEEGLWQQRDPTPPWEFRREQRRRN